MTRYHRLSVLNVFRLPIRLGVVLAIVVLAAVAPAGVRSASLASTLGQSASTYSNPIIPQNVSDPSVIKALDGYYYLAGSSDYWTDGSYHILPIFRSTDLVHWTFVTDTFGSRPAWVDPYAGLWAPDLQYYNHQYYMYYTASWTKSLPRYGTTGGSAIGVATAPTPSGPWTDAGDSAGGDFTGGPIIPPRYCAFNTDPGCYYWTFDPAEFTDHTGQKYIYYGSYFGGTLVQPLAADGLHTSGPATQIGHWDRYEGTYVIARQFNGQTYYYNFSSAANCCAGPNTGYSVAVNRATSPTGTFFDQNGFPMLQPGSVPAPTSRPSYDPGGDNKGAQGGGYPTLKQNGNRWHGTGHNAIIADLSGHQWIVYHAVDKNNGWLNTGPNFRITFRQTMLDRIDWTTDGWPVVNGGAGPSDTNAAPITTPIVGDNFNAATGCAAPGNDPNPAASWQMVGGTWSFQAGTCVTGGFAHQSSTTGQALLVSRNTVPRGTRTECDLRLRQAGSSGRYGCVVAYSSAGYIAVFIDPARNALVTSVHLNGQTSPADQVTPLPAGFDYTDWHHLAIDQRTAQLGRAFLDVTLSDRNRDPLATLHMDFPSGLDTDNSSIGFITQNAAADFDNITSAVITPDIVPAPGTPPFGSLLSAYSDEFNGSLGPQWTWVHEDPSKHSFSNGQLEIIVNGDLYRDANSATNLLLENQPSSNYMIETKITFDPNSNYQTAGLLVYSDDDHYIKVGPSHQDSLNKMLSGKESLEPLPAWESNCDVQPAPGSNVAVHTYTRDQCPNEGEAWDYFTNRQPTENGSTADNPQVTDWLRIYRHGNIYTPYTSVDGSHWVKGAAWDLEPASPSFPIKIGLFAFSGGPNNTIPALFDYVHVYSAP
jgi:arabinan endo-1,5-alpha-L-arabinosidase